MIELQGWPEPFDVTVPVPGDKSLTHRGILFSALAQGDMELSGWLNAADTQSSLHVVRALGVEVIEESVGRIVLRGTGRPQEPACVLDCGNSGTTMRLATGVAAAVPGMVMMSGDQSLTRRPMARVVDPMQRMGLTILTRRGGYAPLAMQGGTHSGGLFTLGVASAQVKSALLLAGLSADDPVTVQEPMFSRDHTERLLAAMGGDIDLGPHGVTVKPGDLHGMAFRVPGDPSSAAFWSALAALAPNRRVTIPSVLFNSTRVGFFHVLERMGINVAWTETGNTPEPWGSVSVTGTASNPITVTAADIPAMVDEVPLLALLATQVSGTSVIRGADELRVKESDRVQVTAEILLAMGAQLDIHPDGWTIYGPTPLHGARVNGHGDHRMAMLAAVAATVAQGNTWLSGEESVAISYPEFFSQYRMLIHSGR